MNIQELIKILHAVKITERNLFDCDCYCLTCNRIIKNTPPEYEYEHHPRTHVMIYCYEIPAVLRILDYLAVK